jgi:dCMP deaminase
MSARSEIDEANENFLTLAYLASTRCKDAQIQEGALITSPEGTIVGSGYRGFPRFVEKNDIGSLDQKFFEIPASENAIYNSIGRGLEETKLYVNFFPCHSCTQAIIQTGIPHIVFVDDRHIKPQTDRPPKDYALAAQAMFRAATKGNNVVIRQHDKPVYFPPQSREWDIYHILASQIVARRSKDPTTQVGAILVDKLEREIGFGYNGFPKGISDAEFPWDDKPREKDAPELPLHESKHAYVVHSEKNAILNSSFIKLHNHKAYLTHFPEYKAVQSLIQSGIAQIHWIYDNTWSPKEELLASQRMLDYLVKHDKMKVVHHKGFDPSKITL